MQHQVAMFHSKFRVPHPSQPEALTPERQDLRLSWMQEELEELNEAFQEGNYGEQIDALCDLLYFAYGCAIEMGVDLEPFFDVVHRSNMLKEGGPTRADGKIVKPDGWVEPDIAAVFAQRYPHREMP